MVVKQSNKKVTGRPCAALKPDGIQAIPEGYVFRHGVYHTQPSLQYCRVEPVGNLENLARPRLISPLFLLLRSDTLGYGIAIPFPLSYVSRSRPSPRSRRWSVQLQPT